MGPKSLLFTLQLPCPAGLATVAGNLVGSAMRVWLWFGRACGEAASLQGRACPSDWLWMTLCCAAVQPRDNSCRCKPRASHGSSLTHCIAGTTVASSGSGYGRHEPLPMLAARTGDQGTRAGCFLDSTFACKLVPCSPVRAASMGSGSCRLCTLVASQQRFLRCSASAKSHGSLLVCSDSCGRCSRAVARQHTQAHLNPVRGACSALQACCSSTSTPQPRTQRRANEITCPPAGPRGSRGAAR